MSADNGVYILKTFTNKIRENNSVRFVKDKYPVYRIVHTTGIDNFDFYENHQPENIGAYLFNIWGKSEVYTDENKALSQAHLMALEIEKHGPLEYGVHLIKTDYTFYGD